MNCCEAKMVADPEKTSELICQSCGRVEDLTQSNAQEGRLPTTESITHFHKVLVKHRILDAVNTVVLDDQEVCDLSRPRFLGGVIRHFSHDVKTVNYVYFLHNYFEAVPSVAWPRKEEILKCLLPAFDNNPPTTRRRAKERFDEWWIKPG